TLDVNFQDFLASCAIWCANCHLTVKAARTQQRGVKHIRAVGRCHDDDALVLIEAVHLGQQLVQRLFTLVVPTAEARTTPPSYRVDFINEDDAGRIFFGALEQITYTRCTDTDKHLDKFGSSKAEERDIGFTSYRARHERLTCTARANQQHTARNTRT